MGSLRRRRRLKVYADIVVFLDEVLLALDEEDAGGRVLVDILGPEAVNWISIEPAACHVLGRLFVAHMGSAVPASLPTPNPLSHPWDAIVENQDMHGKMRE